MGLEHTNISMAQIYGRAVDLLMQQKLGQQRVVAAAGS
jgi:hypothetical protein